MKKLLLTLATVVALAASGCAPQVDVEAEAAAIRSAGAALLQAALAKDWDEVMSFYAADAYVLPPNASMLSDHEAIRRMWIGSMANTVTETWQTIKVEVARSGDLAYEVGTYESTSTNGEKTPQTSKGKYFSVWKKQPDGTWKLAVDTWNSDLPAGGEE